MPTIVDPLRYLWSQDRLVVALLYRRVWNHSDENCIACIDASQFVLLIDFGRTMECRSAVLFGSPVTLAVTL
jgi:hypothetical protein